jgi:hypothetical protein
MGLLMAIAPFINAAAFGPAVRRALEISLGRKVDFEKIYFSLFPVPGFSLQSVTIHEDPRYGLEPFAHASGLEVRLRADKLLLGQLRLSTLRLVEPSLNLVKRGDGTWNVVDLVERLSAPRRMPLSLFPAIEVSSGRIDFKLGTRKTTLYIADSDLSIYPERSGRVIVRFSGSPARTDRAGNGFGHLRGTLNWRSQQSERNYGAHRGARYRHTRNRERERSSRRAARGAQHRRRFASRRRASLGSASFQRRFLAGRLPGQSGSRDASFCDPNRSSVERPGRSVSSRRAH